MGRSWVAWVDYFSIDREACMTCDVSVFPLILQLRSKAPSGGGVTWVGDHSMQYCKEIILGTTYTILEVPAYFSFILHNVPWNMTSKETWSIPIAFFAVQRYKISPFGLLEIGKELYEIGSLESLESLVASTVHVELFLLHDFSGSHDCQVKVIFWRLVVFVRLQKSRIPLS